MAIAAVGLKNIEVDRLTHWFRHAQFEEITAAILLDVHGVIIRATLRGHDADFEARAHHGKFGFNVFRIHRFEFLVLIQRRSGEKRTSVSGPVEFE